jgi:acyl dehydratase
VADSVLEQLRSLLGRAPHQRATARDAVSAAAIRAWCDVIGERRPMFTNRSAGQANGYDDVVAPPAMLQVWTMPGLEPGRPITSGPARAGDLDEEVRTWLAARGYTATMAVTTDQEFVSPARVGDTLVAESEYTTVSNEKTTAAGVGFFLSSATTYRTTAGALIGRLTLTVFHYRPRLAAARRPGPAAPETSPPAGDGAASPKLEVGAAMGPVHIPVTPTLVVAGALATRDFYPVHHDRDFARSLGSADIFLNIMTTNGLLARVVGEWAPPARLHGLITRLRAPAHPSDLLSVSGIVTSIDGDRMQLTVRAATRAAIHAEAVATVGLG